MSFLVKEIDNKEVWESFLLDCEEKTFLQSWNWGEFNQMMGNRIWRFGIYDKDRVVALVLVSKIIAKRGTFLLAQHGPVFIQDSHSKLRLKILLLELKRIAKEENCHFIRMNPLWENNSNNKSLLKEFEFREAPMHANAYEASWKLDLSLTEEEILKNMRKTTRYLIRQAQKNIDIKISQSQNLSSIEIFYQMHREVAKFQKFTPFSLDYLKNEFLAFLPENQVSIFLGQYQKKIIAGAFIIFWSQIGFYHHAALLPEYHKIPVSYLLQWEAIKEAKNRGCKLYDFWGYVDPKKNPQHPWAGPTLFKMGFGGKSYEYLKTQDLPLSKKYWLTFLFEKFRKAKRGL